MSTLPPSPFLDSAASFPNPVADEAAASLTPLDAAASQSSSNEGGHQGTSAVNEGSSAAGVTDHLGCDISHVHELFYFARILMAEAQIRPGTISPQAVAVAEEIKVYEETYYNPLPLFLRKAS